MFKLQTGEKLICHGCLSAGRNLQQLTHNTDLFFTLLDNRTFLEGTTFMDVLLCWECVALLERVKCFQKRIQIAQHYLEKHCFKLENLQSDIKSLSSLSIVKYYEIVSTHCKKEEERSIKDELKIEKEDKVCLDVNTKIKEETFEDLSSILEDLNDTDTYNNYDDITENTYNDVTEESNNQDCKPKVVIKKTKSRRNNSYTKSKSLLDTSNHEIYIIEIVCTPDNLEKLKKEHMKSYKKIQLKVNNHHKKLGSMKSKDFTKLSKSKTPSTCSFCNVEITLDSINSHYQEHKLTTYQCKLCRKTYDSCEDTSKHILYRHRFVYMCPQCDQCFHLIQELDKHLRNDHKCICDHCNKEFRTKNKLIYHMRLMHMPDTCRICNVTYRNGEGLQKHLRRFHVPRSAPADLCYCVECDKHYPHLNAYKAHLRSSVVHVPRRIYRIPCPECGQVFSKKTYMTNHYKLFHLKQTQHYCKICDKYYNNGYGLRKHMLYVHEKAEKPRNKICDICGRAFHNQKILTNHIRTHTGERPHECPYCPAAFAQRTAMVSHTRTQHKDIK